MVSIDYTMIGILTDRTDSVLVQISSVFSMTTMSTMIYCSSLSFFIVCAKKFYSCGNIVLFVYDYGLFWGVLIKSRMDITGSCGSTAKFCNFLLNLI